MTTKSVLQRLNSLRKKASNASSGAEAHCKPSTYCRSPSTLPQAGSQDQLKLRPPKKLTFSGSCKAVPGRKIAAVTYTLKPLLLRALRRGPSILALPGSQDELKPRPSDPNHLGDCCLPADADFRSVIGR